MRLSELISIQGEWERKRGITNHNWGIDRIQVELNEAGEAITPTDKLKELIDVLIITAGSIASLAEATDTSPENIDVLLRYKLRLNDIKYPLEAFVGQDWEAAVTLCRALWEQK